jgi:hypothetical protein
VIATNTFNNVPIILQYNEVNIIEFLPAPVITNVSRETKIALFHPDGTLLGHAIGARIIETEAGKKAGLKLEHPDRMTFAKMGNRTLFEMRRPLAAVISLEAELFTQNGYLVKLKNDLGLLSDKNVPITLNGVTLIGNTIKDYRIGIKMNSQGDTFIGSN